MRDGNRGDQKILPIRVKPRHVEQAVVRFHELSLKKRKKILKQRRSKKRGR